MNLDQRAAFTLGVGYGPLPMAMLGLWSVDEAEDQPDLPIGKRDLRKKLRVVQSIQQRQRREIAFFLVGMP